MNLIALNISIILILLNLSSLKANTINVCSSCQYTNIAQACLVANPGDTIEVAGGTYSGGMSISNLHGTENNRITIQNKADEVVILQGGSNAIHFSELSYITIRGLTFQGQTGNGLNIDDGGTIDTPTHNIIIENCRWLGIAATGNNDLLKMSGVDDFIVRNCLFRDGSPGGSGIDMVGCHKGLFSNIYFENQGSNSIQCKGGTSEIEIFANLFQNGGQRAINIGGSTGLQFFRPIDANYEAKNIYVFSNVFIGGVTPIAFVGAVECEVVNNTIYLPEKWVMRILQETTEPNFLQCSNNKFMCNLIIIDDRAKNVPVNIGSNTLPNTFRLSGNLWYNEQSDWSNRNIGMTEETVFHNTNPNTYMVFGRPFPTEETQFIDESEIDNHQFHRYDYVGEEYRSAMRTVGAIQADYPSSIMHNVNKELTLNYSNNTIEIINDKNYLINKIEIYDILGKKISENLNIDNEDSRILIPLSLALQNKVYIAIVTTDQKTISNIFIAD